MSRIYADSFVYLSLCPQSERLVGQNMLFKKIIFILFLVALLGTATKTSAEEIKLEHQLNTLAWCESGNNPNVINHNDGGSPSYGLFQWKIDSFWRYNLKYKVLPDIEKAEIRNIIMEPNIQRLLTKRVLQEKDGWRNWYNCLK